MSYLDDVVSALAASSLPENTRSALQEFLLANRDWLEAMGAADGREILAALATAGPNAAWDAVLAHASEAQLLALLQQSHPEWDAAVAVRTRALQQMHDLAARLGHAALQVGLQALLAAL